MHKVTTLGGDTVGKVAHGLMMMTWNEAATVSDTQAFNAIKAGVDGLPSGAKMLLNSGEFYGPGAGTANLELLARFFEAYPEYADKTFLSVKGGLKPGELRPDSTPENLRRSVDRINEKLRGTKKLDLFESARVDPEVPIEESIRALASLVKEGKIGHIGLSECSANTLRRANSVHPIAAVEIEVSLWAYEDETRKVIETAKELNVAVVAYSPLGRGLLTGHITKSSDLADNDLRKGQLRFRDDILQENQHILQIVKSIAEKRSITPAQLSIAWVASLGNHVIPLPGASKDTRVLENVAGGDIDILPEDLKEIERVLKEHPVQVDRYWGGGNAYLWG